MKRVRFGTRPPLYANASEKLHYATMIENIGFDSVWLGDHLIETDQKIPCVDPWSAFSAFAVITKRVALGTCVTDPHKRHPAVLAQTVATVNQLSGGRVIIGLGAGEAMNLKPFNIHWDRSLSRMKEAIEILKQLLVGEKVTHNGEFYKLDEAYLTGIDPIQKPYPPIYVAGQSSRSRKMAGMLGDGWIALLMSPELYKKDLEDVRKGAALAGRNFSDIDVTYSVSTSISKDFDEAKGRVVERVRAAFLWWPRQLRRYGYEITDDFDWLNLVVTEGLMDKAAPHFKDAPVEVAEQVCIYGTPDDVIDRIEEYIKVGVTHFILTTPDHMDEFCEIVGKKIIPYFREAQTP